MCEYTQENTASPGASLSGSTFFSFTALRFMDLWNPELLLFSAHPALKKILTLCANVDVWSIALYVHTGLLRFHKSPSDNTPLLFSGNGTIFPAYFLPPRRSAPVRCGTASLNKSEGLTSAPEYLWVRVTR